ncbi:hypothetical protein N9J14_01150, partial [bacterium]|nr:hypothetical protein [bacterium]
KFKYEEIKLVVSNILPVRLFVEFKTKLLWYLLFENIRINEKEKRLRNKMKFLFLTKKSMI